MRNREDFLEIIKSKNYKIGLEMGVRTGDYSRFLVKNYNWEEFYGIDCDEGCLRYTKDLIEYNYKMMIGTSPNIASEFKDNFFDFIYIDAWHTYESTTKDLIAWYPKLKEGGLFCGDDYMLAHNHPESKFQVVEAVEDFCNKNNISYKVTELESLKYEDKYELARQKWIDCQQGKLKYLPQWYLIKCSQ